MEKSFIELMLPETLDDLVGQTHILTKGKFLYNTIVNNSISSLVIYGPPGSGKTALAQIIARQNKGQFYKINGVLNGVRDVKKIFLDATEKHESTGEKTILFLDEIHRFNKAQQDVFLPMLENNYFILIGATTENPFISINNALLSRSIVVEFNSLSINELKQIFHNIEKKLDKKIDIDPDALELICRYSNGDARRLIRITELLINTYQETKITTKLVKEIIPKSYIYSDKNGDAHYDRISAFIKSVRGSDVNAALYWLAALLIGGEDPYFLARRLVILASEDIGNADPQALLMAEAALRSIQHIGMPEAKLTLAQITIYLSLAPKSNGVYKAINKAWEYINDHGIEEVPSYLRSQSYKQHKDFSYKYPHNYKYHYVHQKYMLTNKTFYTPGELGFEKKLNERMKWLENLIIKDGKGE